MSLSARHPQCQRLHHMTQERLCAAVIFIRGSRSTAFNDSPHDEFSVMEAHSVFENSTQNEIHISRHVQKLMRCSCRVQLTSFILCLQSLPTPLSPSLRKLNFLFHERSQKSKHSTLFGLRTSFDSRSTAKSQSAEITMCALCVCDEQNERFE